MSGDELREKLRGNVATMGERYFVDPDAESVGPTTVDHWKLVLGSFAYLSKGNVLLVGEPGTGKTTFANLVGAALSGLPFDLFTRTQIQGHPDQTKEEMLARAHVGKLTVEGREEVVWQHSVYMPLVLIDEFNRLPEGKQSIVQEFIRTGTLGHLNEVFHRGALPFAATVNEADRGTYAITPPNLDRFDVSLEFTHGVGWLQEHVERAWDNLRADLGDPGTTTRLLRRLRANVDEDDESLLAHVDAVRAERRDSLASLGLDPFSPEEEAGFLEAVEAIELSPDAKEFVEFLYDEVNLSSTLNHKRRSDDPAVGSHDQGLAYSKVENGISARRRRAIEDYARMTAFYVGSDVAERDHVRAVAPYCLAHTLEFTDDFRAEHATARRERGEREDAHLTRTLLRSVEDNYDDLSETIRLLNAVVRGAELTEEERDRVERLLYGSPEPDHPHVKVWVEKAEDRYRTRYASA